MNSLAATLKHPAFLERYTDDFNLLKRTNRRIL
jgi:hypothetical protein